MPTIPSLAFSQLAGEPRSTISVRNIATTAIVGTDAWGRSGKPQPVSISVSLSLRAGFGSAAKSDAVDRSTVHYGILSKEILDIAARTYRTSGEALRDEARPVRIYSGMSLREFLNGATTILVGSGIDGSASEIVVGPVVEPALVHVLELRVCLPKASLLGSGVSMTVAVVDVAKADDKRASWVSRVTLRLHDVVVPTIIGVNANERLAKQLVVANVEIDNYEHTRDSFTELEQIVSMTIAESSFGTLEKLAVLLVDRIILYFIYSHTREHVPLGIVKVRLGKPTAVPLAEAPEVQYSRPVDPREPANEILMSKGIKVIPYPLQQRLDEWIIKNVPGPY